MPKDETTKIEKIVECVKDGSLKNPRWIEEYNKDGIVIFSDDIFGSVKLVKGEATVIDGTMVALDGVVAFSNYASGGIGGIVPYVPYVRKDS